MTHPHVFSSSARRGSGKGTAGCAGRTRPWHPVVSTGDIFRANIKEAPTWQEGHRHPRRRRPGARRADQRDRARSALAGGRRGRLPAGRLPRNTAQVSPRRLPRRERDARRRGHPARRSARGEHRRLRCVRWSRAARMTPTRPSRTDWTSTSTRRLDHLGVRAAASSTASTASARSTRSPRASPRPRRTRHRRAGLILMFRKSIYKTRPAALDGRAGLITPRRWTRAPAGAGGRDDGGTGCRGGSPDRGEGGVELQARRGYRHTTCISVNEQVVHGIPGTLVLQPGDIVSVDCGPSTRAGTATAPSPSWCRIRTGLVARRESSPGSPRVHAGIGHGIRAARRLGAPSDYIEHQALG